MKGTLTGRHDYATHLSHPLYGPIPVTLYRDLHERAGIPEPDSHDHYAALAHFGAYGDNPWLALLYDAAGTHWAPLDSRQWLTYPSGGTGGAAQAPVNTVFCDIGDVDDPEATITSYALSDDDYEHERLLSALRHPEMSEATMRQWLPVFLGEQHPCCAGAIAANPAIPEDLATTAIAALINTYGMAHWSVQELLDAPHIPTDVLCGIPSARARAALFIRVATDHGLTTLHATYERERFRNLVL